MKQHLSHYDAIKVIEEYRAGSTVGELCKKYGRLPTAIISRLKTAKIYQPGRDKKGGAQPISPTSSPTVKVTLPTPAAAVKPAVPVSQSTPPSKAPAPLTKPPRVGPAPEAPPPLERKVQIEEEEVFEEEEAPPCECGRGYGAIYTRTDETGPRQVCGLCSTGVLPILPK